MNQTRPRNIYYCSNQVLVFFFEIVQTYTCFTITKSQSCCDTFLVPCNKPETGLKNRQKNVSKNDALIL